MAMLHAYDPYPYEETHLSTKSRRRARMIAGLAILLPMLSMLAGAAVAAVQYGAL